MGILSNLFNREMKDVIAPVPEQTPQPTSNYSGEFYMLVEDVFTIAGRGTVVTGRVEKGEVHIGDIVSISGRNNAEVTGIEMFRKTLDFAKAGDNCGILLKDISRNDIHKGDYLAK